MGIKELMVIGKSDATITMILDNLESINLYPNIIILNNMNIKITDEIENNNFKISFVSSIDLNLPMIMGVFRSNAKKTILNEFKVSPEKFINIIHNSSQLSSTVKIKNGCVINSLVSIASHTVIGDFVSINRNVSIGHHSLLEDFVTINPGCNIAGNVKIGQSTTIGIGTNVIEKIKIGKNTIVGAGSLVTKDLPDNVIAYGNPCKIIRENG